jgi:hypothetical protein
LLWFLASIIRSWNWTIEITSADIATKNADHAEQETTAKLDSNSKGNADSRVEPTGEIA